MMSYTQKRKCHVDEILVAGCNGSNQIDNLLCNHLRKFRQNGDISVSVNKRVIYVWKSGIFVFRISGTQSHTFLFASIGYGHCVHLCLGI